MNKQEFIKAFADKANFTQKDAGIAFDAMAATIADVLKKGEKIIMEQINTEKFDELLKGDKPVVCDFFATWCGPCRMLAPVMDKVSAEFADKAVFVKVDIDQNAELAVRYGIMSIPLVAVFKNGEKTADLLGYTDANGMTEFLNKNL